jgi:hypothetical protein
VSPCCSFSLGNKSDRVSPSVRTVGRDHRLRGFCVPAERDGKPAVGRWNVDGHFVCLPALAAGSRQGRTGLDKPEGRPTVTPCSTRPLRFESSEMQRLRGGGDQRDRNDFGTARRCGLMLPPGLMVASPVGGALGGHRAGIQCPFPAVVARHPRRSPHSFLIRL